MLEVREVAPGLISVVGSVDLTSVAELRTQLAGAVDRAVAEGMPALSVDLSAVQLMDAAGLGALLGAHRRARRGGSSLRLVRLGDELSRLLLVSRLYRVLDITEAPTAVEAPADVVPHPRGGGADEPHLTSS